MILTTIHFVKTSVHLKKNARYLCLLAHHSNIINNTITFIIFDYCCWQE